MIIQILTKWQRMRAVGISRQWAACSHFEDQVNGISTAALAVEGILGQQALTVPYTGDAVAFTS